MLMIMGTYTYSQQYLCHTFTPECVLLSDLIISHLPDGDPQCASRT